jgi:serine protease Do
MIGLKVTPLTDELRRKHGLDRSIKGLLVTEADPQSPAAEKGIKAGDVIVEAAQEQVNSVDDLARNVEKVRKSGRKAVLLRVEDGKGDMRFVAVPLD